MVLVSRTRNPFTKAGDFSEDEVGISGPGKRFGIFVAPVQVIEHGGLQFVHSAMAATFDAALGYLGKEPFYKIEPTTARRREVQVVARMTDEPAADFVDLMSAIVVQHHVDL